MSERARPYTQDFTTFMAPVRSCLHQSGVGTDVKHTASEEEDQLWSSGALNVSDHKGLQQAVFYYVGKVYCICGGEEQRCLNLLSLSVRGNQTATHILNMVLRTDLVVWLSYVLNKQVPCYANPGNEPRYVVFLSDRYFKKLPP